MKVWVNDGLSGSRQVFSAVVGLVTAVAPELFSI